MVRPALAVALAAALCAAAVVPPVGDQALSDDIAVGAVGPCDGGAPCLGQLAMVVPPGPLAPEIRVAIVTPWRDHGTGITVRAENHLADAPKTSPPT